MAREKIIYNCARLTGFLLLGATVLHGTLGTAEVMTAIKLGDVAPSMQETFRVVWVYSTIMLALSAAWTFFIAAGLRQLSRRAWWQGLLIGLGYTGGSAFCMAAIGVRPHLVMFMLIGLVLLLPLLVWIRSFGTPNIKSTV
jgi:hypothetical protein